MVRSAAADAGDVVAQPPDTQSDAGQGRQLLKELMERRRRNDFVRRREFDQLRRLRRTGAALLPEDVDTRHSLFQLSTIDARAETDDRAVTLRKIDEIEEQMSRQWWKTRPPNPNEIRVPSAASGPLPAGAQASAGASRPAPSRPASASDSSSVAGMDLPLFDTLPPTQPNSGFVATSYAEYLDSGSGPRDHLPHAKGVPDLELPDAFIELPVELLAPDLPPGADPGIFVHHPLLEEAAILFANGDPEAADKSLRGLVAGAAQDQEDVWAALFDLYRALGRQDRFDAISITFAERFGRSPPAWFSLSGDAADGAGDSIPPVDEAGDFHWRSPAALGPDGVARLYAAAAAAPGAWWMDWSPLARLDDGAAEPLLAAFGAWSEQPVVLRFENAEKLVTALEARTLSGDTDADPAWWRLRMEALRLIGHADAFEEVALDYCITYEVSPPSWHMARCDCRVLQPGTRLLAPLAAPLAPAGPAWADSVPMGLAAVPDLPAAELSGDIARNVDEVLLSLDGTAGAFHAGDAFVVDCGRLVRLDFAAAGSVLNWAATQQGAGRRLQFRNLHRLAATFFNVIGIDEYALVHARKD